MTCTRREPIQNIFIAFVQLLALAYFFSGGSSESIRVNNGGLKKKQPHIIHILADDLGYTNVGFSAKGVEATTGVPIFEATDDFTPNINEIAARGIVLKRHYAYHACTPSRSAFLSGRLPVHIGVLLGHLNTWDGGSDTNWGFEGLPLSVSTIGAKLKSAGYKTAMVGKADGVGMATPRHQVINRGFDTFFGFYSHGNDLYDYDDDLLSAGPGNPACTESAAARKAINFFNELPNDKSSDGLPFYDAFSLKGRDESSPDQSTYSESLFGDRAVKIIADHNTASPLFLAYWSRMVHTTLKVPDEYFDLVGGMMCEYNPRCLMAAGQCPSRVEWWNQRRRRSDECALYERIALLAQTKYLDDQVGRLVNTIKANDDMWANTIIVFQSDNGGGIGISVGGNSYPMRGGKGSSFDGGVRVPTFIGGGLIDTGDIGRASNVVSHITDWYATFCHLAGVSPKDDATGVAPVDSVNLWPCLDSPPSSERCEVRSELHLTTQSMLKRYDEQWFKVILWNVGLDMIAGPDYPNTTCPGQPLLSLPWSAFDLDENLNAKQCRPINPAPLGPLPMQRECGNDGCLFNLDMDPSESRDLSQSKDKIKKSDAKILDEMRSRLVILNEEYVEPWRGCSQQLYCNAATKYWALGSPDNSNYPFIGPFVDVRGCGVCASSTDLQAPRVAMTTNECQCDTPQTSTKERCEYTGKMPLFGMGGYLGDSLCMWTDDGHCELSALASKYTTAQRVLMFQSSGGGYRDDLFEDFGSNVDGLFVEYLEVGEAEEALVERQRPL